MLSFVKTQTYRHQTTSMRRCIACMRCRLFVRQTHFNLKSIRSPTSHYSGEKHQSVSHAGIGSEIILCSSNELRQSWHTRCAVKTPPTSLGKSPAGKKSGNRWERPGGQNCKKIDKTPTCVSDRHDRLRAIRSAVVGKNAGWAKKPDCFSD